MINRSLFASALPFAVAALLLSGCSSTAATAPCSSAPAPSKQDTAPATDSPMETGDILDLCEALPKDDIAPVLDAYGFPGVTLASSTAPGDQPVCTLTSSKGAELRLHLVDTAFDTTIDGELGSADAPPENDSVYLPKRHAFAAAYLDSTLLVTDATASAATPAMLFLAGTALDNLP